MDKIQKETLTNLRAKHFLDIFAIKIIHNPHKKFKMFYSLFHHNLLNSWEKIRLVGQASFKKLQTLAEAISDFNQNKIDLEMGLTQTNLNHEQWAMHYAEKEHFLECAEKYEMYTNAVELLQQKALKIVREKTAKYCKEKNNWKIKTIRKIAKKIANQDKRTSKPLKGGLTP